MTRSLRSPASSDGRLFAPLGDRAAELGAEIESRSLAGLLLTSDESVYYTTGYTTLPSAGNPILHALRSRLPPFVVVAPDGQVTLGCWGFSVEGVSLPVDAVAGFNDFAGAEETMVELLASRAGRAGTIGIESSCPYFFTSALRDRLGDRVVVADDVVDRMRLVKSPAEVAFLSESLAIAEAVVDELFEMLHPGMSRLALMREARDRIYALGADGVGHMTFTFGETNPEIALDEKLASGRLAALDVGAIVAGYRSDNRRYAFAGEPSEALVDLHGEIVRIVNAVGDALVPGALYSDVHERAITLFAEAGVPMLPRFSHAGHNIGLETEERWVDDTSDDVVRPGMVINIELYARIETGEQIGDEETFVVDDSGSRRISVLSTDIRRV